MIINKDADVRKVDPTFTEYIFLCRNSSLGFLTSGNTEMLLFSRFSSSSSRHLANDLGMADNLLYLRPKRFMLARFPERKRNMTTVILFYLFGECFQVY